MHYIGTYGNRDHVTGDARAHALVLTPHYVGRRIATYTAHYCATTEEAYAFARSRRGARVAHVVVDARAHRGGAQ